MSYSLSVHVELFERGIKESSAMSECQSKILVPQLYDSENKTYYQNFEDLILYKGELKFWFL